MASEEASRRVGEHVAAFNAAVVSGDWGGFAARFSPTAVMRFVGVPAGPYVGRDAIRQGYATRPPTDTMNVARIQSDGETDLVSFVWSSGGQATMQLTWERQLVSELVVTFVGQ